MLTPVVEFHPRLVEEAVRAAIEPPRTPPEEDVQARQEISRETIARFHREREQLYGISPASPGSPVGANAEREDAFARFHARWFQQLGMDAPVRTAVTELRAPLAPVARILVGPADSARREGAEMYVASDTGRTVVVLVRPGTLARPQRALDLMRRELMHVVDMIDPCFGYEPRLPAHPSGLAHDRMQQERYRVLWAAWVEERLIGREALPSRTRDDRVTKLARELGTSAGTAAACFDRIASPDHPRHCDLVAMASDPESMAGPGQVADQDAADQNGISSAAAAADDDVAKPGAVTMRCFLCGFPTSDLMRGDALLVEDLATRIRAEIPAWTPDLGACRQCVDLYLSRSMSDADAAGLPRAVPASESRG